MDYELFIGKKAKFSVALETGVLEHLVREVPC